MKDANQRLFEVELEALDQNTRELVDIVPDYDQISVRTPVKQITQL